MENNLISGLPNPIPLNKGFKPNPNKILTAKLQAQNLELKILIT